MGDMRVPFACFLVCTTALVCSIFIPPFSPFLGITLVLSMLESRQEESTNRKVVQFWSHESHVVAILNF